jgi:hypothetical protein
MKTIQRWRGLAALVTDAVEHGSHAVEQVHLETAERPFRILESIPGIEEPTRIIHAVHHTTARGVYQIVRLVNQAVRTTLDVALNVLESSTPPQ